MKYQTQRAMYYTFATQEIESGNAIDAWRQIARLFSVPTDEWQWGEKLLSDPTLAWLKTAEDVRLFQKCASGFGSGLQELTENLDSEILELKYQVLFKIKQLTSEYKTSPLKAVGMAYHRDPAAAVLYALQILLRNEGRKEFAYRILSESLSAEQNSDAGILLLNDQQGIVGFTYARLAETPEMILHPEVLEELAKAHGINPAMAQKGSKKIGF